MSYTCRSQNGYNTQDPWFRENAESKVTSDNKMLYIRHERTSDTNTRTIQKWLIQLAFRKQNYYHRIKYIISKSSSSKYNEVFNCYLYSIKELLVYKNTSLGPAVWQRITLYKQQAVTKIQIGGDHIDHRPPQFQDERQIQVIDFVSSPVWWEVETNKPQERYVFLLTAA